MADGRRALLRQGAGYLAAGGLALLVDWGVFVLLTRAAVPTAPANLLARLSGAGVAYVLNGAFTFRGRDGARLGWARLARFALVWCVMTALSTAALSIVDRALGLGYAWMAKPVVEALLAVGSFLLYRYWIYR